MKRPLFAFVSLVLAIGCSAGSASEELGSTQSAIINGRPSGDDENAAVFINTILDEHTQSRCSGRIIAPGLVLSARHCFLNRKGDNVRCTPDGEPLDTSDVVTADVEPAEQITVYIGSNKATQRAVAVKQVLANFDVSLCRGDIAYLVLAEPGLDTHTPIRKAPPNVGDTISVSGWGYVDDTQREMLPDTRSTVDTTITLIGPGSIPDGTFAVNGRTLCLGDSGANALLGGSTIGVYTRIDGNTNNCNSEVVRNILTDVMSEADLLTKAFTAIGEEPWFEGEEKPWLAAAGAACMKDDDCRGGVCDASKCIAGCGPTKLACKVGQQCMADACVATPPPPPAPKDDSSCAAVPGAERLHSHGAIVAAAFAMMIAGALWRRRRASTLAR